MYSWLSACTPGSPLEFNLHLTGFMAGQLRPLVGRWWPLLVRFDSPASRHFSTLHETSLPVVIPLAA